MSLHDTTTEIVVGLGHAADLVAVTEPRFLSPEATAAVAGVPRLPSGPVSAESLEALHPTLVLGTDVIVERQPELAARGLWIDPAGLDGLWASITQVADALGAAPEPWLGTLRARVPSPDPRPPVPVFLYDCCDPPFTAGGRAPLSELLALAGARNVFDGLDQDWGKVSWEAVAAAEPRLVVVHDYSWEGQGDTAEKVEAVRSRLGDVPVTTLPLALALEGPRTLDALAVLAPALEAAR